MLTRIYKERLPSFGGYLCEGGRVNMTLVVRARARLGGW